MSVIEYSLLTMYSILRFDGMFITSIMLIMFLLIYIYIYFVEIIKYRRSLKNWSQICVINWKKNNSAILWSNCILNKNWFFKIYYANNSIFHYNYLKKIKLHNMIYSYIIPENNHYFVLIIYSNLLWFYYDYSLYSLWCI